MKGRARLTKHPGVSLRMCEGNNLARSSDGEYRGINIDRSPPLSGLVVEPLSNLLNTLVNYRMVGRREDRTHIWQLWIVNIWEIPPEGCHRAVTAKSLLSLLLLREVLFEPRFLLIRPRFDGHERNTLGWGGGR